MSKRKSKIAVAMSGGVDSSVVARILKDEGHEIVGLFLKLWSDPKCSIKKDNRCCDYQALEDARLVAKGLSIPFYVINAREEFKQSVVDYFLNEYKNLRTPNPCVVCNQKIKFGLLLRRALEIGCDKLATGHYARVICEDNNCRLFRGKDDKKDQSYMLYSLSQDQLRKVIFPIGGLTKKEVRALASRWRLPVYEKPESQEICFFADRDYRLFLQRYLPEKYFQSGDIVNTQGEKLGEHKGLINYTIGQRKRVEQDLCSGGDKRPLYVVGYNLEKNQLIVGEDAEVYKSEMVVSNLNWLNKKLENLKVKIRYQHPAVECRLKTAANRELKVKFKKPQRAITPGQSAVFYSGDEVVGGGVIKN